MGHEWSFGKTSGVGWVLLQYAIPNYSDQLWKWGKCGRSYEGHQWDPSLGCAFYEGHTGLGVGVLGDLHGYHLWHASKGDWGG